MTVKEPRRCAYAYCNLEIADFDFVTQEAWSFRVDRGPSVVIHRLCLFKWLRAVLEENPKAFEEPRKA